MERKMASASSNNGIERLFRLPHRFRRSQGSMENLMTYGYSIMIVMVVGITLWQFDVFNMAASSAPTASGFHNVKPVLMNCQMNKEVHVGAGWDPPLGGFKCQFQNTLPVDIYVEDVEATVNGRQCLFNYIVNDDDTIDQYNRIYRNNDVDTLIPCGGPGPDCDNDRLKIPAQSSQMIVKVMSQINTNLGDGDPCLEMLHAEGTEVYDVEVEIIYSEDFEGILVDKRSKGNVRIVSDMTPMTSSTIPTSSTTTFTLTTTTATTVTSTTVTTTTSTTSTTESTTTTLGGPTTTSTTVTTTTSTTVTTTTVTTTTVTTTTVTTTTVTTTTVTTTTSTTVTTTTVTTTTVTTTTVTTTTSTTVTTTTVTTTTSTTVTTTTTSTTTTTIDVFGACCHSGSDPPNLCTMKWKTWCSSNGHSFREGYTCSPNPC